MHSSAVSGVFDQIQALAQASFKKCSIRRINIHSTEEAIETVKEMGCGMVAQGPRALFWSRGANSIAQGRIRGGVGGVTASRKNFAFSGD